MIFPERRMMLAKVDMVCLGRLSGLIFLEEELYSVLVDGQLGNDKYWYRLT